MVIIVLHQVLSIRKAPSPHGVGVLWYHAVRFVAPQHI
jgi:hypothetical protein